MTIEKSHLLNCYYTVTLLLCYISHNGVAQPAARHFPSVSFSPSSMLTMTKESLLRWSCSARRNLLNLNAKNEFHFEMKKEVDLQSIGTSP